MSWLHKVVLSLLVAGMNIPAAQALLMERLDLKELAKRADDVVHGTVIEGESHVVPDTAFIYTDWIIQGKDLKPQPGEAEAGEFVVRVPGGQHGDWHLEVSEMPRLEPGKEGVFFLRDGSQAAGFSTFVGGTAGMFRIEVDPVTHRKVVRSEEGLVPLGEVGEPSVPMNQFLQTLEGILGDQTPQ
jgi:hypothetical protein